MNNGVEINIVVSDCLAALEQYEQIFELKRIEVTNLPKGQNEVVFEIFGTRFHLLDENPEFHLIAPEEGQPVTMWMNVTVPDIKSTFEAAIRAGCDVVQEVVEIPNYGVSNASFVDSYGYHWMIHQVHRVVGLEERIQLWENQKK